MKGRPHKHKGSHAKRAKHKLSAAARAKMKGRKHPHKGVKGHSKGFSAKARAAAAKARRGHHLKASTKSRISHSLKGKHIVRRKKR